MISIQCIEGAVGFDVHECSQLMRTCTILLPGSGRLHSVDALRGSSILARILYVVSKLTSR